MSTWILIVVAVALLVFAALLSGGPRMARRRSRLDSYLGVREREAEQHGTGRVKGPREEGQRRVRVTLLAGLIVLGLIVAGLVYLVQHALGN